MSEQYHDKFSDASKELPEKSGFVCLSCKKRYSKEEAEEHEHECCGRTMKELVQESFGP